MNDRYIDHGESNNFPEDAFNMTFDVDGPVEFNDTWLISASEEDQATAMRDWFTDRYCDAAHETPYNGREGGYLYINGGPYNPTEELNYRFSECIPQDIIDEVAAEFESEGGDEWAPISYSREYDYDDLFSIAIDDKLTPQIRLKNRISELQNNLIINNSQSNLLNLHMSYSMLISYLEAYLSDTVIYWARQKEEVLFRLAIKEFEGRKYSLSDIFGDIEKFKAMIHQHLESKIVWHRLDKIKPTLEYGLKIEIPAIDHIMEALVNRHDIVHRGGFKKDGERLQLSMTDFNSLKSHIKFFVTDFEEALINAFISLPSKP